MRLKAVIAEITKGFPFATPANAYDDRKPILVR
jgi:hypothetical protein